MSDRSSILSMPFIQPSQAQKHVTHNEALRQLDAVVQLAVISADLTSPPLQPDEGARYIVAAGGSGDWAGQDGKVAVWTDAAWMFYEPNAGWRADVLATGGMVRFDGSVWSDPATGSLQNTPYVGVNTTSDTTNRLSVASSATLLNHEGGDHQLKVNKAGTSDTASLLFQTGFGGRAEMGIAGNDDFSIKVSSDGTAFKTAIVADASDGSVQFPQGKNYFEDAFIFNDDAYSFDVPFSNPARILMWLSVNLSQRFYLFSITGSHSGANNFAEMFASPAGTLNFLSGPLDGTTGPDGAINLSIDATVTPARMYVENRLGSNRLFTLATLGK